MRDAADLADTRSRCPGLDTVAGLARGFAALVRHEGTGQHLDAWINRSRHAGYPEIRGFAAGLASDRDAVIADLSQFLELRPRSRARSTASRPAGDRCTAARTSTSSRERVLTTR
ncbi:MULTISPECIES: hypothetical protein [Micromonospora]|uniref:hypothetical protein n=1 Tax=Micromonospora TaxID=1873 RepID=UPI0033F383FC